MDKSKKENKQLEKENKLKEKEENQLRIDNECATKIPEILKKFVSITQKKPTYVENKLRNLLEEYLSILREVLCLWRLKIKGEKVYEDLYLGTLDMVEFALGSKEIYDKLVDSLDADDSTQLLKFFYATYERFTQKKNTKNLKPMKIYKINHLIVDKHGIGTVNRSLFNTLKTN